MVEAFQNKIEEIANDLEGKQAVDAKEAPWWTCMSEWMQKFIL